MSLTLLDNAPGFPYLIFSTQKVILIHYIDSIQLHKGYDITAMRQLTVDKLAPNISWFHFINIRTKIGPVKQKSHLRLLETRSLDLQPRE